MNWIFIVFILLLCNECSAVDKKELFERWVKENFVECPYGDVVEIEKTYYDPAYKYGFDHLCKKHFLQQAPNDIKIYEQQIIEAERKKEILKNELIRAKQ